MAETTAIRQDTSCLRTVFRIGWTAAMSLAAQGMSRPGLQGGRLTIRTRHRLFNGIHERAQVALRVTTDKTRGEGRKTGELQQRMQFRSKVFVGHCTEQRKRRSLGWTSGVVDGGGCL